MADQPAPKLGDLSAPALVPIAERQGARPISLNRPFVLIGSRNRAHLHLVSRTISRNHACLIRGERGYYLRDLASRTGIIVNGRRVKETDLHDGDSVEIGSFRFKYAIPLDRNDTIPAAVKSVPAVLQIDGAVATPLDARTFVIGRRGKSDISLPGTTVSKSHALVFQFAARHHIRDLGSRTGTLVNGKPVRQQLLEFGDEIKIGETIIRYRPAIPEQLAAPEKLTVSEELTGSEELTAHEELIASDELTAPEEESDAPEAPIGWNVTAVVAEEPESPQGPLPWIGGSPIEVGFDESSAPQQLEEQTQADPEPEDETDPDEWDDDSGPVPWRGADGRPLYVKMHVPKSLAWFPAMADVVELMAEQSARQTGPAH